MIRSATRRFFFFNRYIKEITTRKKKTHDLGIPKLNLRMKVLGGNASKDAGQESWHGCQNSELSVKVIWGSLS